MTWDQDTLNPGRERLLQLDIRKEFGLPFQTGSHLAVFQCKACNDQTAGLYDYFYIDEATAKTQDQLRANYWDFNGIDYGDNWKRFYRIMLIKPGSEFDFLDAEEFIQPCSLIFAKAEEAWMPNPNAPGWVPEDEEIDFQSEPGLPGTSIDPWAKQYSSRDLKIGGQPAWGGDNEPPNHLLCSCGAPMGFVCFIPDELVFPNNRPSVEKHYNVGELFTGLCVYILACRAQCHPFAVYPVTQP